MGLDMYLYRRRYVKNWNHNPAKKAVTLAVDGQDVPLQNVAYIYEEVGYWRKANAIHGYFVELNDGVDDCEDQFVDAFQLKELYERCLRVEKNPLLAQSLLPVTEGFFFGSYDYGEGYFQDIKDTLGILQPLLPELDPSGPEATFTESSDWIYRASW